LQYRAPDEHRSGKTSESEQNLPMQLANNIFARPEVPMLA
jgi:hypothetical protein